MRTCAICKKGSVLAGRHSFLRGHYNPTGKVRKYPNLQSGRMPDGTRALMCARCLKAQQRIKKPR